jgi:hypothetical protein
MAQPRDAAAIRALLRERRGDPEELEVARLVSFDPRRRMVICATALIGSTDTIVGIGAMDLDADGPDLILVDDTAADGLEELLTRALVSRARQIAGRRAA